jgi:hypothetical protein
MEKRSRRRTRDLVTHTASQGLSQNEIGCARISIMARGVGTPFTGRIQMRKTNPLHRPRLTCNARPVHTEWVTGGGKAHVRGLSAVTQIAEFDATVANSGQGPICDIGND